MGQEEECAEEVGSGNRFWAEGAADEMAGTAAAAVDVAVDVAAVAVVGTTFGADTIEEQGVMADGCTGATDSLAATGAGRAAWAGMGSGGEERVWWGREERGEEGKSERKK